MEINLNNQLKKINQDNLFVLITEVLGDKTKGVAVAINQTVVPRENWNSTVLKEHDSVLIIKATQGGWRSGSSDARHSESDAAFSLRCLKPNQEYENKKPEILIWAKKTRHQDKTWYRVNL